MTNSKMIGRCENCNQDYCQECSNAKFWDRYCSKDCEKDVEEAENE